MAKGQNHGTTVRLRPVAFQMLTDLAGELSEKRGQRVSKSQVIEAALRTVNALESVEERAEGRASLRRLPDRQTLLLAE